MHATTTRITMNKNKCKYTECESLRYTYETCAKEKRKKKEEKEKRKQIKERKTSSNKILSLYIKII